MGCLTLATGVTTLSKAYCNLAVDCYGADSPREEVMRARCRSAYIVSYIYSSQGFDLTDTTQSIISGDRKGAQKSLDTLDPENTRTLKLHHLMATCVGMLELKTSLHK